MYPINTLDTMTFTQNANIQTLVDWDINAEYHKITETVVAGSATCR